MKISKTLCVCAVGAALGTSAYADCSRLGVDKDGFCPGVWCSDGCYVCCNPSGSSSGTDVPVCSPSPYSTEQGSSFSDEAGSGYIQKYNYTNYCKCINWETVG